MHGVRAGRQAVTTEMFRDAVRQTCDDLIEGETGRECVGGRVWRASLMVSSMCVRRQWHPTPILLPGKPHGRRSLVGCSPWGR